MRYYDLADVFRLRHVAKRGRSLVDSFAVFIAIYAVAGLGNTAYHPADYSLLSHHSPSSRVGQNFSIQYILLP